MSDTSKLFAYQIIPQLLHGFIDLYQLLGSLRLLCSPSINTYRLRMFNESNLIESVI